MLRRLVIQNFRSLEEVAIDLDPLTALVGPNGSGKSSILRALDMALGQSWPTIRSFRLPHDFTRFDDTRDLRIRVRVDPPLMHVDAMKKDHAVHGFELRVAPYTRRTRRAERGDLHCDFHPLGNDGTVPTIALNMGKGGPNFGPFTNVPPALRDDARVLFVDHRRSVIQHQPWARGSILARLLGPARRELGEIEFEPGVTHSEAFTERYQAAVEALRTPRVREIESTISETARQTLGFLGSAVTGNLGVRFGFADPANPFGTLRLLYDEGGMELPAEEVGSGIQSAIVVGIFEAFRRLGTSVGTVLIEEPEMYLHPQAQRYFHRLLVDLVDSGQCQVIYSTHSPIFADITRFESIRLVRRAPGAMTTVTAVNKEEDREFLAKRRSDQKLVAFTTARSEALFAHRALLVEGAADVLAVRMLAEREDLDLDGENLSVIDCGSKHAIPFIARTCRALGIPVVVLHDRDVLPVEGDEDERTKIEAQNRVEVKANDAIADAVGDGSKVFVAEPSLEGLLGISANARDKPRRVAEALEGAVAEAWPAPVRSALAALTEG
ncbi:MAG TPA: AAA family ATPase [Baekduia sp.]|nr:AAA family ATPase [Baekduia sp.]